MLRSQAKEVLARTYNLRGEEYKNLYISKSLNEKERIRLQKLRDKNKEGCGSKR